METVSSSPPNSPKNPRKRAPKTAPTEADLVADVANARKRLRDLRTRTRTNAITRLGTLAYDAGLASIEDDSLKTAFADVAKRLGKVICALGVGVTLLATSGCVPGGTVDRELGKLLGVRSPEEQAYCHTIQQSSLAKTPPEIPPSCDQILQRVKDEQAAHTR